MQSGAYLNSKSGAAISPCHFHREKDMKQSGINIGWMDRSVDPGKDFYRFACGGYIKNEQIPVGYSRWGSFYEVRDRALNRVHDILRSLDANDEIMFRFLKEPKLAYFYQSGMDEAAIEEQGLKPIEPILELIDSVTSSTALVTVLAQLHQLGFNALFGFGSMSALDGSGLNIAAVTQGGLGLPDRDYYLKDDQASVERLAKYKSHIERMLQLIGDEPNMAGLKAGWIVEFEKRLAQVSISKEAMRDPFRLNNMQPRQSITVEGDNAFNFELYFEEMGAPQFDYINVLQPEYLTGLNGILAQTPFIELRAYLQWCTLRYLAPFLTKALVSEHFDFYQRTLNGVAEPAPRWRDVVGVVNEMMGEAVGQLYVARHFPPEAKARVMEMIENGRQVMRTALQSAHWLSPESRDKAMLKLDRATFKIGYPDKWIDYEEMYIYDVYVHNVLYAAYFHHWRDLDKIGQPIDKAEWNMTPQTVNAYANPLKLEVVFPAGILQPPLFDVDADDAANYGAIMAVILHEFGHFFDDQGANFDADGKLNRQWSKEDFELFMAQIQLLRNQASRYAVGPNQVHLKGDLVSGEAAADLNGARLAFRALQIALEKNGRPKDETGFTDEQRFFIAFAQVWCVIITPEALENQAMTDPHPPGEYRCNGTLAHMEEFARAFGLPDDAPIMLPKEERARIW